MIRSGSSTLRLVAWPWSVIGAAMLVRILGIFTNFIRSLFLDEKARRKIDASKGSKAPASRQKRPANQKRSAPDASSAAKREELIAQALKIREEQQKNLDGLSEEGRKDLVAKLLEQRRGEDG